MRNYWRPKYERDEEEAKKNPGARKIGKTKNDKASRKVLWDRYLSARRQLWDGVVRQVKGYDRFKVYTNLYGDNHLFYTGYWPDWHLNAFKAVDRLEKEMIRRGF